MEDREWFPMTRLAYRHIVSFLGVALIVGSAWAQSADSLRTSTIRVHSAITITFAARSQTMDDR